MSPYPETAPVEAGESYHFEIEEIGNEGDGIGYVEDFVVIVPNASLGESVDVEVERVDETFAMASRVDGDVQ
ncbi:MAG: TRAM domain-containing protein [Halodesulfurarchaeum sp.]